MESTAKKDHLALEHSERPGGLNHQGRESFIGPGSQYAYNAARMYAVNAAFLLEKTWSDDAAKYASVDADRAMACLNEAVVLGFMDTDRMKTDRDLDVLRGREDFKKLIAALEKKTGDGETAIKDP
jgi:hypothetical protein